MCVCLYVTCTRGINERTRRREGDGGWDRNKSMDQSEEIISETVGAKSGRKKVKRLTKSSTFPSICSCPPSRTSVFKE